MRAVLLLLTLVAATVGSRRVDACVYASEANRLIGWSADGAYGLYADDEDGKIHHAEILPTTYTGYVYFIESVDDDGDVQVARAQVGQCTPTGGQGIVETKRMGTMTDASLLTLRMVAALKFGRVEQPIVTTQTPTPLVATFTGKKRYDAHDIQIAQAGATPIVMPLPVACVGSCMRDEDYTNWDVRVVATHTLASGMVLYELAIKGMCNGANSAMPRLVAQTPPSIRVPKVRCHGVAG